MKLDEKQIGSESIFSGVLLDVFRDTVQLPDGREAIREYIKHPGAAVMVPVLPDDQIILERQYRYPLGKAMVELPAGKIDPGEDPLESARRELLEETGYEGQDFIELGMLHPCIGYSDEVIYIYLVRDLRVQRERQDQDEFIETFTLSLPEALDYIRTGKITDAKSIVGLLRAEKHLVGEWFLPE